VGIAACGDDETTTTTTITEDAPVTTDATGNTGDTTTGETTGETTTDETTGDDETGDVSGNCDEAEHANDPECTGGVGAEDDSSGPGDGY
jgi:hypothetical protein